MVGAESRSCLLLALLTVLLAACGNPTVAGPSGRAEASTSVQGSLAPSASARRAPYKFGLLASLSGPNAAPGIAARDAVQLEAKQLNDGGGLDGHHVDILVEDDQSDPSQAVVAFKDIANQDAVAVIGPEAGAMAVAVLPLEDHAKLPAISLVGDQAQSQPVHRFVFVAAPPASLMAASLLSYLQKKNIRKIAVLHEISAEGSAGIQQLKQQGSKFGVQVIVDETYQLTDTDMTRQINNVKNNPAVEALVEWGASGAGPAAATQEFQRLGLTIPLLLTSAQADPSYLKATGSAANGAVLAANKQAIFKYLLPDDPSQRLLARFIPAYKQAAGKEPDRFAARAYDAFHLLAQAISKGGSTAPDAIVAQLEKTTFNGAAGAYSFSSSNHAGMQPGALAIVSVQGGQLVPIKPNCAGCAETTVTKE